MACSCEGGCARTLGGGARPNIQRAETRWPARAHLPGRRDATSLQARAASRGARLLPPLRA
eukprot:CAMPEP_0179841984 /NCGR_PEP_ID=MMETSP0982-20121206/2862_1 /TAXON_ID=483367 /ORGANISM="non described non described, Strain CCMP 2436" /LENGTH=60 /DNA_ID=CAMNT_0021726181 /DNA_START=307 /DNA_END=489 /DNA_ORIENTATION=+